MTREEEFVKYQLEQHQRNQEIDKTTQNMSTQERDGFVIGVEWADQNPRKGLWDAEKVIEWLRNNSSKYMTEGINYPHYAYNSLVDDLTKAMED